MDPERGACITFVIRHLRRDWRDLECLGEADIAREPHRFVGGRNSWIAQSYVRLRGPLAARGFDVRVSDCFVPGALCIAHRDDANAFLAAPHRSFLVVVRADRAPVHACDLAIIQNGVRPAAHERFVPLWPQPGLVPRDAARGYALRSLAYHGRLGSAPEWFASRWLRRELSLRGIAFEPRASGWEDYRDVDIAIAARRESPSVLATKPATKLYNAWHAGVPLLAMPEPAYLELRRSPFDFIEIRGERDVVRAVDSLRRHPQLYRDIVENGRARAEEFGIERTRERWLSLIEREALPAWRRTRDTLGSRRAWYVRRMARQKLASRVQRVTVAWERWVAHPRGPRLWLQVLRSSFTRPLPRAEGLEEASNARR
jgi:hypothetical protein